MLTRSPRSGRLTAAAIVTLWLLPPAGESLLLAKAETSLPSNAIVPLSGVSRSFPGVTREASAGPNSTATGNPEATRMVIYETSDGSKKVTISLDQYAASSDASAAYQQAVQKSRAVPGLKPVPVATLGQRTFAGTTTIGTQTHIGLGALDHNLIVGATLAGYDATPDNVTRLVALARIQCALAKKALGGGRGRR
jgi:hypothetical protein